LTAAAETEREIRRYPFAQRVLQRTRRPRYNPDMDPARLLRDRGVHPPADLPPALLAEFARVVSHLWIDGGVVPLDAFRLDPADEGLLFGRGAWESARTFGGKPWLWDLHLGRLTQTCDLLGFPVDPGRLPTAAQVAAFVRGLTAQDVLVRLNVTAGPPGRPGKVWLSAGPLPAVPAHLALRSCPNPVGKGHAYLTLKTFQYATRLRLHRQAVEAGFDSALVLDDHGHIQEAAHANVFVRLADGWATPLADGGFLPGTVRQHVLRNAPLPVREAVLPFAALGRATEVFVTNSNAGVVPVTRVDGFEFPVGRETLLLRQSLVPSAAGVEWRFVNRQPARR
jgi:branched-subunit amino acid aminotransferase/4-amino-4-deoxychorismate lyase